MGFEADLRALETDAQLWDGISEALSTAGTTAADLTLSTGALSWAAEVTGLTTTYAEYQSYVADLLDTGGTNTAEIAAGLRQVKTAYETAEDANSTSFDGLWDANSE